MTITRKHNTNDLAGETPAFSLPSKRQADSIFFHESENNG